MNQQLICNLAPFFQTPESSTNFSETRQLSRDYYSGSLARPLAPTVAWQRASRVAMATATAAATTTTATATTSATPVRTCKSTHSSISAVPSGVVYRLPPSPNVGYFLCWDFVQITQGRIEVKKSAHTSDNDMQIIYER